MMRDTVLRATIPELADSFCQLDSEAQAEFFAQVWRRMHEVCEESKASNPRALNMGAGWQFYQIGRAARERDLQSDAAEALGAMAAPLYVNLLGLR